jgi:hypothetical protein
MSVVLNNTKNIICKVFEEAADVFKTHNMDPQNFAVQIAVYRNYNVDDDLLLQHSGWEVRPENLRTFMSTIGPDGGMGNEAIEIGLLHANAQLRSGGLSQVILIGDMPPNTRAEVPRKFNYTQRTKFTTPTYWEDELAVLIQASVPVHAFYVNSAARNEFQDISRRTGGESNFLDVNNAQKGSTLLKKCITERILLASAGSDTRLAETLVRTYRAKYT